ncbi:MAG: rhodanese-like domain-containing protein [Ignavibacteriota bacterium]
MVPFEVTVEELKSLLDASEAIQLIDCRRQDEYDLVNLGGKLIEMNTIPMHLDDFDAESKLIIMCRTGSRSAMVTEFLRRNGFPNAQNLQGGIYAWSERIDPSVKKY